MITDLTVLDHEIHNVKDKIYFCMFSKDKPTIYLLCYGEILIKEVRNLTITYFVQLQNILESKESIKKNFHMQNFRILHQKSKTFGDMKFNVLDILDDIDFSDKLFSKTSKYLFHTTSYLSASNADSAKVIQNHCNLESQKLLNELLQNNV